jgi:transcription antitermination factor NusG
VASWPQHVPCETRTTGSSERAADDLLRIRSAPGVAYVLPRAGQPAVLPDAVIQAMQQRESELLNTGSRRLFNHGDAVRVTSGPFKWIDAVHLEPAQPVRAKRVLVRGGV